MGLEERLDTYASFYDLTKAFACVSFDILLKKLSCYNFHRRRCAFVESYLADCTQFVTYNGNISTRQNVRQGVPQGSVLEDPFYSLSILTISQGTMMAPP